MPGFGNDRGKEISISGDFWHANAFHNAARLLRQLLKDKARDGDDKFDVHGVETSLPTPKTCRVERYLEHVRQSIGNFQQLYAHYQQERELRWKTYRRELKTLREFCMYVRDGFLQTKRSKKNKRRGKQSKKPQTKQDERQAKDKDKKKKKRRPKKKKKEHRLSREDVVVAIGSAQFGSVMRGLRGVPLKRFFKLLAQYVQIVWVDEYRTSRVCSKCSERRLLKEDEEGEEKTKNPEEERVKEEEIRQR